MYYSISLSILTIFFLLFGNCFAFFVSKALRPKKITTEFTTINFWKAFKAVINDAWDEEEQLLFNGICERYLQNKFQQCGPEGCVTLREIEDARSLLREVLPPMSSAQLDDETRKILESVCDKNGDVSLDSFVSAIKDNRFWESAGARVVQELIYLDCVNHYYRSKSGAEPLLQDSDFDWIKGSLIWEGSIVPTVTGNEALFISAVAAHRRGRPILSETEYLELKSSLIAQGSWVTARQQDPLEKMGFDTFMGYLHKSM